MVPTKAEMNTMKLRSTGRFSWRAVGALTVLLAAGLGSTGAMAGPTVAGATQAAPVAPQTPTDPPMLTARVSRWQGEPAQTKKGPKGFDLQIQLIGARFDGTFGIEGLPQRVPAGEAFDAQIKFTNFGTKGLKVASVFVTGEGVSLATDLLVQKVDPKTAMTVASFKVPAQSAAGSSLLITVVMSNGDRHKATLRFSKPA